MRRIPCAQTGRSKTTAKWLVHLERHHREELWLKEEGDEEAEEEEVENDGDEESDFENS